MTNETCDLLINAKYILPIIPQKTFSDCSIAIKNGNIIAILPTAAAKQQFDAHESFDLDEHIVMPGLINAHGHAAMSLLRGFADDYPLNTWLEEHIWPTEAKYVSAAFVKAGSQLALAEMIRSGTTCFSDMYFFPEETASVAHDAGIRCQLAFPLIEFANAWAENVDDAMHKGLSLRDTYRSHELIDIVFGPHAPYTVSDDTFQRIATLAPELQTSIQVHLHETQTEVDNGLKDNGQRPLKRLHDLQVLGPLTQCVHMTAINNQDIQYLQQTGAHVIHCPESNLKLASGFCTTQTLLDAGINVALGTDGCASNNNLDLFGEMHTAALLGKAVSGNAAAISAQQALAMATINGARALNIADKIGSLEVGKCADMIAIKIDPIAHQPLYNITSQLVYTHNGHRVTHSWVQGRTLMKDKQLLTLNEKEIIANTAQWQQRLQAN